MVVAIDSSQRQKYWQLIGKENYPDTPRITKQLDEIQKSIKAFSSLTQNEGIET